MSNLVVAISLAVNAHAHQKDLCGEPYIMHSIRVMTRMDTDEEKMVAIMHDVVEDTDVSLDFLRTLGFSDAVVHSVDCITKREDEKYHEYVERVASDEISKKVKIADIEDNMDIDRIPSWEDRDTDRNIKYYRTWLRLKNPLLDGGGP